MNRSRSVRSLAALAVLLLASTVAAAPPKETGLGGVLTGEARAQWQSGREVYQSASGDADYRQALIKFKRAYELTPDSRLLFNIAACEKQLKHYAEATRALRKYLDLTPGLTVKDRDQALAILKSLAPFISELTVTSSVEGAVVTVDGEPLGTTPITEKILIDTQPAQRTFRATKEGMRPFEETRTLPGIEPTNLTITMVADRHEGHLAIDAAPDALIAIDSKPVGSAGHYDGNLAAGVHVLHVEAKGKKPYDEELTIRENEPRTMTVTLLDQSGGGVPAVLWAVGGVVVAGGLVTAGYFIFRPSDVPGTIPNGNLAPGHITPTSRLSTLSDFGLHFR